MRPPLNSTEKTPPRSDLHAQKKTRARSHPKANLRLASKFAFLKRSPDLMFNIHLFPRRISISCLFKRAEINNGWTSNNIMSVIYQKAAFEPFYPVPQCGEGNSWGKYRSCSIAEYQCWKCPLWRFWTAWLYVWTTNSPEIVQDQTYSNGCICLGLSCI